MRQVAAGAALTVALAGIVGGVYVTQQPRERVELIQPASGEVTAVPVETSEPAPSPTTVPTSAPVETTASPAPVESTVSPKPAPKETTVTKRQSQPQSEPAPSQIQPESPAPSPSQWTPAPDDPIRQTPPPGGMGGAQVPGQPFLPGEYHLPPPAPSPEG